MEFERPEWRSGLATARDRRVKLNDFLEKKNANSSTRRLHILLKANDVDASQPPSVCRRKPNDDEKKKEKKKWRNYNQIVKPVQNRSYHPVSNEVDTTGQRPDFFQQPTKHKDVNLDTPSKLTPAISMVGKSQG